MSCAIFKFSFIFILLLMYNIVGGEASVTVQVNPGCKTADCGVVPWVIVVHNIPDNDANGTEYFHVWGGSGAPTVMVMEAAAGTELTVDWQALATHQPLSVTTSPAALNTMCMTITELVLFDDPHDTGSISDATPDQQVSLPMELFEWTYQFDNATTTDDLVNVTLSTTHFNGQAMDSRSALRIMLVHSAGTTRGTARPRLTTTPASTTASLVLDNLLLNITKLLPNQSAVVSQFRAPRWAVRQVLVSSEGAAGGDMMHVTDRSLDDEYAPGVFKLDDITTPRARSAPASPEGGYLQWRPVCYLTKDEDITKATLPSLSPPANDTATEPTDAQDASDDWFDIYKSSRHERSELAPLDGLSDALKESLVYGVLGEDLVTNLLAAQSMVSFGESGDKYYAAYNYTIWTLTVGSGVPPTEGLSTSVLIVIICGLGLPVLVLILAGVGLNIWRLKNKKDEQHDALIDHQT